jgi:pilus assembly protein CpaB
MKVARLAVLGVALTAGLGAAYLMSGSKPPQLPPAMQSAPALATDDVLVAARDLSFGAKLTPADMRWQAWPRDGVPQGAVRRSQKPNALEDDKDAILRGNVDAGAPLREDRLVTAKDRPNSGFMSAILEPGTRAVAINIDAKGSTTAGGFILPNDRVDVIRTYVDEDAKKAGAGAGDFTLSETILSNVRVLAIEQIPQERNNERVVLGSTATLELTEKQAEAIVLAQRTGQLSLTLRSMGDSQQPPEDTVTEHSNSMTIVRYGVRSR